jgi:HAD superfamily hydrolase (TIGR01549 family)
MSHSTDFSDVTTIIFDMDGTLIRHTWDLSEITGALFTRFAADLAPVTHNEFFEIYWPKMNDMWQMMIDGVLDGHTAVRYSYANTLRALGQDTALAEPKMNTWHELVLNEALPFDDTYVVLDTLRDHYKLGILTNGFIELQRQKIERYQLAAHVDFTLVSEEAGYHKPDARVFAAALKMAGDPDPAQTIYVGDCPKADIGGAQNAGLTPVWIDYRNERAPLDGVIKIQQLSELLDLLPGVMRRGEI